MNLHELDSYFRDLEARDVYSGVVLVTQGDNELFAGAYGCASRAWDVRNTLETRFDTASVTKLFTAVSILQLVEQGLVSLDASVVEFLSLTDTTISKEVTLFHLLTHSSGIGDDADEEAGERYEDLWKEKPNYSIQCTADFLPQILHNPPNFPPGEGCRYCNVGFILLGLVIEQVTGLDYAEYVQKHVFDRCGMASSGFFRKDHVHPLLAEGNDPIYDDENTLTGWKRNIYSFPPIGSPDAGTYVTAADLDRFLRSVQAGELLSPPMTAEFLSSKVDYNPPRQWRVGYGLEFFLGAAGDVEFFEKEGINSGVSAMLRHIPSLDINIVLLSNMENGVWEPAKKVYQLITS